MRGVTLGEYHTADDWGLILNAKTINPPDPKYVKIAVDGRDGDLNLSRSLTGELKYNNREISFTFLLTEGTQGARENLINEIINLVHGNELQIIEPDDLDHYFIGECNVNTIYNDKAYGSFIISANCEPYRYRVTESSREVNLSSTATDIVLTNGGRKILIPTVIVNGSVNLKIGATSVSLASGTHKITEFKLTPGSNLVTVSGSGTVAFKYREAVI